METPLLVKKPISEEPHKLLPYVMMSPREIAGVILAGFFTGVSVAILYALFNKYVFTAVLCRAQAPADCSLAPSYSMIVAMVVAAVIGGVLLARQRVFRPLLVVFATAISLWGIDALVAPFAWYWALLIIAGLFALSYGLFGWVARLRSFGMTAFVAVVLIVIVRLSLG